MQSASRLGTAIAALAAIATFALAAERSTIDPRNAEVTIALDGLKEGGETVALRLVTALGALQHGQVTTPADMKSNVAGTLEDTKLQIFVNASGKPAGKLEVEVVVDGAKVTGSYKGTWGKAEVEGKLSGTAAAGKGRLEGGLKPPLTLLRASYFGTSANDNLEGAVAGPDGSLCLVGNVGVPLDKLPDGGTATTLGAAVAEPRCACGFVLRLSADGGKVLGYTQFAPGILHATAVAATDKAVYVGGYASDALEPLLTDHKGFMAGYPLRTEQRLIKEGKMLEANGLPPGGKDPMEGRPGLGRLGAPCVLRFSPDLKTLEGGTFLEGWQQIYDKHRICGRLKGRFHEFFWQPINICPLSGGDVAVAHDGGYFRMLTDKDREAAAKLDTPEKQASLLKRLAFNDVADYVSRLSGDLSERRWKTAIYTPPTVPEVAAESKPGWSLPYYSSPRTHRMRMDKNENLWVCGWSASATSKEPWWSPFLYRFDAKTGAITRKLYEYDPMSGGGQRMGGTVADTALLSVAIAEDGDLLTALIADGGNAVMGWGPLGNEGKRMTGPVIGPGLGGSPAHFWGQAHRIDGRTLEGLGGARSGPWAWTIDVAGLPQKHFLALGRFNGPVPWSPNAWWTAGALANPNAFLRVVGPDNNTTFWTAIPGVRPFELMPIGGDRYILVGFAAEGAALQLGSLMPPSGGEDAWFAIVKWEE